MVATQLHLVRHGEVFNPNRVLYGRLPEYGLSEAGHQMAALAAADLAGRGRAYSRLIASPLQRTQESAAPVSKALALPIDIDERVIEPTNAFEGKRMRGADSALKDPGNWKYLVNPFRPSWGEPYVELAGRMRAAVAAAAHGFIRELPEGYDTVLGEGGHTLSGGQRQAVAIGRAVYWNAQVLIMDEPTAALGPEETAMVAKLIGAMLATSGLQTVQVKCAVDA